MKEPLIAHIITYGDTGLPDRIQTLEEHSRNVAQLCGAACRPFGLESLGRLTGLLHDMGKAAQPVQAHIRQQTAQKLNHSAAGMRWLWEYCFGRSTSCRLMAQMSALAIGCHHSGRCDYLAPDGSRPWLERMRSEQAQTLYQESVQAFFDSCCTEREVGELVEAAAQEVAVLYKRMRELYPGSAGKQIRQTALQFGLGFVQRFLFSCLIDADWADTAGFMKDTPLPQPPGGSQRQRMWGQLSDTLEANIRALKAERSIDLLRQTISAQCFNAGHTVPPGIYRLYVPTGGGKTYSGLRFCVEMARRQNARHILYFAPYKSVTRQNADCIRRILGAEYVLEHHSDVLFEEGRQEERERWLALSQRWQGVPVICTTIVQLLDTLFAAPRQNVRRLSALAGSVLLLDEIQALPLQDVCLLDLALNVLAHSFGCTIVLCTATQPELAQAEYPLLFSPQMDIVPDYEGQFRQFRRTRIVPPTEPGGMTMPALADFVASLMEENRSILVILNTKSLVNRLFDELKPLVGETPLFCLTTYLCQKHREDVLQQVLARLGPEHVRPVICISTQLIEAGVDISFDCVVRDLAGLPSIAQAAGRCNRHGQDLCRPVYLVECADEHLDALPEIAAGREATDTLLRQLPAGVDLLSPEAIRLYYQIYYGRPGQRLAMQYPVQPPDALATTMVELLSCNLPSVQAHLEAGRPPFGKYDLCQGFGTAERAFAAIPDETVPILAPYGKEGEQKLMELQSAGGGAGLLEQLQPYTLSISRSECRRLGDALVPALDGAALILRPDHYDSEHKGLSFEPLPLPFCSA